MTTSIESTNHFTPHSTEHTSQSYAQTMLLKAGIRFYTEVCIRIPKTITDKYFTQYYLVFWRASFIVEKMVQGTITRDDITYQVRFHNTLTRGKLLADPHAQVSLSFRAPIPEFGISPVVLIGSV